MRSERIDPAGQRILVVRPDGLGDVILCLPVFAELRRLAPGGRLTLFASPVVAPLFDAHPWIDEVVVDERSGRRRGLQGFRRLVAAVRNGRFDGSIHVRPTIRHALAAAAAGVRWRVGTGFRAHSLIFTHRVPVHRRGSGRHEVELNLDLLAPLGGSAPASLPWIPVAPAALDASRALVGDRGPYVVLHPGTHGSARDWPPGHFARLGGALAAGGIGVLVTGAAREAALTAGIAAAVPGGRDLAGRTPLPLLAALLAEAQAVVAASTGPLHLAAAVGTPVVGLYPDRPDSAPARWGPRGRAVRVLAARAGEDLASIAPQAVLAALEPWLGAAPAERPFRVDPAGGTA